MTQHRPNIKDDDRLSLTQASRELCISRTTFYVKAAAYNVMPRFPRDGGRPYYLGKDVLKIWLRS